MNHYMQIKEYDHVFQIFAHTVLTGNLELKFFKFYTINFFSLTMRSRPCAWKLRSIRKTGFGFNVDHLIRHKASI